MIIIPLLPLSHHYNDSKLGFFFYHRIGKRIIYTPLPQIILFYPWSFWYLCFEYNLQMQSTSATDTNTFMLNVWIKKNSCSSPKKPQKRWILWITSTPLICRLLFFFFFFLITSCRINWAVKPNPLHSHTHTSHSERMNICKQTSNSYSTFFF